MSAIFGLYNLSGEPVHPIDLERVSGALAAHGTDADGFWTQGQVGLGHRLMRFTPEDCFERQPLVRRDGPWVLVSDGRIDNRPELLRELDLSPDQARTTPDSEFILRAYEKWGEECPRHLIGSFTFALWDGSAQRLVLARSAIASPALFYRATPETLAFATMPKGLFALDFVPRQLDEEYLAAYLARIPREPGTSFYREIHRLLPGHRLVVNRDGLRVTPYWQADLKRELWFPRDEDYVEAFNDLFERVISDHLRSITPTGVMMSGGFDSTSVAATAARLLAREGKRLATFTEVPRAGFDGIITKGRYADETPYVHAMARQHPNLDVNLVHTDGCVYLDGLASFFQAAEVPFRNASNRVWFEAILRAAGERGVRVILTGATGNLTISWNGDGLMAQLVRAGKWQEAWREARALARQRRAHSPGHALLGRGILPLLPNALYFRVARLRRDDSAARNANSPVYAHSPIHPKFAREHRVDEHSRSAQNRERFRLRPDTRANRVRFALGALGAGDGLDAGYEALFRVTFRDPTCDVRLFEFCLALPEEQYQREGQTRWLLRRAMANRLPTEVLENPKRGLQAADWFERLSGAQARILDELAQIEGSDLARRTLDLPRLRRLVEEMPQASADANHLFTDYRGVLEMGLMTGCFIRWVETAGRTGVS